MPNFRPRSLTSSTLTTWSISTAFVSGMFAVQQLMQLATVQSPSNPKGSEGQRKYTPKNSFGPNFFATAVPRQVSRHNSERNFIKGNFPESGVSRKSLGGVQQHDKGRKSWHQKKTRLENTRVDHRFFLQTRGNYKHLSTVPKKKLNENLD